MSISCYVNSNGPYNSSTAWVLDIGASFHICTSIQELTSSRVLGRDEVNLKIGNGASVAAKVVGSTSLHLDGHVLFLDRVLVLPNAYRNIVSISSLTRNGYVFDFRIMFAIFILEMILWVLVIYTMVSIILELETKHFQRQLRLMLCPTQLLV